MIFRRVWFLPVPVFYVDSIDLNVNAQSNGFRILIRTDRQNDESLIRHEMVHIKHSWLTLIVGHAILYDACDAYRKWDEGTAFREQMRYPDVNRHYMTAAEAGACLAMPSYALNITPEAAAAYIAGL